jgi:hypothetical protein
MIEVCEVGPRDGLQNEDVILSPRVRGELCERLAASGLRRVDAVSFVRDDLVPAMAGATEVLQQCRRDGRVAWAALVLNEKGYQRAVDIGVDEVRFAFPVTDTYAMRNQRTTVSAAVGTAIRIVERARDDGVAAAITLSAAFGCPFEGPVSPQHVLRIAEQVLSARPDTLLFADSIGVGVPRQVRHLAGANAVGCHSTTPATRATPTPWPRSKLAQPFSTPPSEASAAVRSHQVRPATSPPRTSSISSKAWATRRASISTCSASAQHGWLGRSVTTCRASSLVPETRAAWSLPCEQASG